MASVNEADAEADANIGASEIQPSIKPIAGEPASGKGLTSRAEGLRERIPVNGLREYWYPALRAREVGRRKPAVRKLLGEIVVFFRGGEGRIAAVTDVCPHRGAALSQGETHFAGTLSCPYHGWTFDEHGECLAVLGEGPDSRLAGQRSSRVRVYPTVVLQGIVFVWMGDGLPAPCEEDLPPEFFSPDAQVMISYTEWATNWRPSMENYFDAHVFYVHRNSLRVLGLPASFLATALRMGTGKPPQTKVVNGRALQIDTQGVYLGLSAVSDGVKKGIETPPQYVFKTLGGGKWPANRLRLWLSVLIEMIQRPKPMPPLERNEEWRGGMHLPAWVSTDNSAFIYRRMAVPVDETHSRIFYFHTRYPKSALRRLTGFLKFVLWRNWTYNYNFSGQDGLAVCNQYYDRAENLSGTDAFPLAWRRLVVTRGRDFLRAGG